MRLRLMAIVVVAMSLFGARSALAQESGAVGVTMGFPASIGVIWHVTDKVAIRPELSFAHASTESAATGPIDIVTSTESDSVQFGVSALFYLQKRDSLRTYVTPRYSYASSESSAAGPLAGLTLEIESREHSFGGSFGAQYNLGERFAVFGEIGLIYTSIETTGLTLDREGSAFGTRSGVGVTLYF
jgi:hypothetical protein